MQDKGHDELVKDVGNLYSDVKNYEFHDFRNKNNPAPKMALVGVLEQIIENVKDGKYDN